MNTLKIVLLVIFGLGFTISFLVSPSKLFLAYILIKPAVDRFAEEGVMIGGMVFGFHYLPALALPTMSILALVISRSGMARVPFKLLVFAVILINIFSFILEGSYSVNTAGFFIRVIFPMFLYFTIPVILHEREQILKFIKFSAIAGLFPCAMIFLQRAGFIAYNREAEGLGSETYARATGGYADSFSVALPIIIAIFCVLFLLQDDQEKNRQKFWGWILLGVYLFSLVFTFHRMSFVVVSVVVMMWTFLNRRGTFAVVACVLVVINLPILMVFVPDFYGDIGLLTEAENTSHLSKDQTNAFIDRSAWHGRGWVWMMFFDKFMNSDIIHQLFGISMAGRAPHNDYLRVLITNGMIGLFLYLILLLFIGAKVLSCFLWARRRTEDEFLHQLSMTTGFMFIFYVLASTTLCVSLLSTISWYFWIFMGITFHQTQLVLDEENEEYADAPRSASLGTASSLP